MAQETRKIKTKIKSVNNIKKITKAMEMVAAGKMKKMVAQTLAARPYADYAFELMIGLSREHDARHPLLHHGRAGRTLLVIISANKGLCGSYNVQLARAVVKYLKHHPDDYVSAVTVGRYAERLARRLDLPLTGSFVNLSDNLKVVEIRGLFRLICDEYKTGAYFRTVLAYTHFVSALSYRPTVKKLFPLSNKSVRNLLEEPIGESIQNEERKISRYLFEPNAEEVFESILEPMVESVLYEMLLESAASEHSARMFAMKNASDNADRAARDLTLSYNQARQEGITKELAEIVSGSSDGDSAA